jgi:TolA-binding protein
MLHVLCAAVLLFTAFAVAPGHAQQSYQDFQRWQSQQLENTRQEQLYHQRQMEQELQQLRSDQQRYRSDQEREERWRENDQRSRRTLDRLRSPDDD